MLRVSVSNLDLYRIYREDEDYPLSVFLKQLRGEGERTPGMERGYAFAKAMELAAFGESSILTAEGHSFGFTCDVEIEAWPRREEKREKDYGGVIVTARCDRVFGRIVADDKTTENYDVEGYIDRFQWRYYLDLWEADEFRWHVWEVKQLTNPREWEVYAHHLLKQYRYKELEADCRELAQDFAEFATTIGRRGRSA
jgi:hypothetical protein